ncbi:MAG: VIT1/CCC1 transporter family protein [Chlorobiota bacterium]
METRQLLEHWHDERESALVYDALAEAESDTERQALYRELAEVERRHQVWFEELLRSQGVSPKPRPLSLRTRFLLWMIRRGNARFVVHARINEEAREVRQYLREQPRLSGRLREVTSRVARDESEHIAELNRLLGNGSEPWHRTESGGFLRNVVYGFNDGLTANFGLVMGVIGAEVAPHIVLLSGVAGLVADALSMGASGYLAAKSEREVYEHEIQTEREELQLMPELEREELVLLYRAKGMPLEQAQQAAEQVMADPELALREKVREELGIGEFRSSPLREGVTTGVATALGALVPVVPFLFGHSALIVWISFAVSMLMHFVVGAARSIFTGRGVFRSGLDMFLVGLGVAVVGYVVGDLLMRLF